MTIANNMISPEQCQQARLSRDARFDGLFFTAVKTTGIYCRSICPATPPKEQNVAYFETSHGAAMAGYRPCLRCRPDSAPHSAAWLGNQATLNRAIKLINAGALSRQTLGQLATYLGVSDRYLRQLFQQHLGTSPKQYALYQQCLLAKQLLHQTSLPVQDVALASGFNSVRRFNDCMQKSLHLTPSEIRKHPSHVKRDGICLKLNYRPPYDWSLMHAFLQQRSIEGLETVSENSYGRNIQLDQGHGGFIAHHRAEEHAFEVLITWSDWSQLPEVVQNIRRVLDLDADMNHIHQHLSQAVHPAMKLHPGLRLPGIWSLFEAGVRAILGQQVTVQAARKLVTDLTQALGHEVQGRLLFPSPESVAHDALDCIKMPAARKQTLRALAHWFIDHPQTRDPEKWLAIKGIGPWTVNYAKMRGMSDPDIYLAGDLGVIKATQKQPAFNPQAAAPWRSYLTFQLWQP